MMMKTILDVNWPSNAAWRNLGFNYLDLDSNKESFIFHSVVQDIHPSSIRLFVHPAINFSFLPLSVFCKFISLLYIYIFL